MKTIAPLRRHGLAMPIVLAVIVVLTIMALGLFLFGRSGLRQTGSVVADVEHLYRAEGIFHRVLGRLKRSGWDRRYYAPPGERTRCCSTSEQGVYRGASYELWVQDLPDEDGTPIPGIVDLLIRVVHRDTARNFVTRLRLVAAADGSCRGVTTHFARAGEGLESPAGRRQLVEEMNRNEGRREANRAESDTMARALREKSRAGETTATVLTRLRQDGGLGTRIQRREAALEAMRRALRAMGRAGAPLVDLVGRANGFTLRGMDVPPDPVRARAILEQLMARLETLSDGEGQELFRLAAYLDLRCRRLEIETMSILAPERQKRVEELLALADRLADADRRRRREGGRTGGDADVEEWALGPYVFLELARARAQGVLHGLVRKEEVNAILAELAETWPDHRLFGDDLSVDRIWESDRRSLEGLVLARATFPPAIVRAIPGLERVLETADGSTADETVVADGAPVDGAPGDGTSWDGGSADGSGGPNTGTAPSSTQGSSTFLATINDAVTEMLQTSAAESTALVDAVKELSENQNQGPNVTDVSGTAPSPRKGDPKGIEGNVTGDQGDSGMIVPGESSDDAVDPSGNP